MIFDYVVSVKSLRDKFIYVDVLVVLIFVDELIVLDITATPRGKAPAFDFLREIASECFMPVTYGGGVRSLDDLERIFSAGIEKVAINTAAIPNATESPTNDRIKVFDVCCALTAVKNCAFVLIQLSAWTGSVA